MKRSFSKLSFASIGALLSACTATPEKTTAEQVLPSYTQEIAAYVVPVQYRDTACPQLGEEAKRLWARITELEAQLGTLDEQKRLGTELSTVKKVSIKKNCEWSRGRVWAG
jgi:hypothetical protein